VHGDVNGNTVQKSFLGERWGKGPRSEQRDEIASSHELSSKKADNLVV